MENKTNQKFQIEVTLGTAPFASTALVAGGATWDGAWYTRHPESELVKVWKTRRGAQKWLAERPLINGKVVEVTA